MAARKKKETALTQDDVIREYLEVYHRCMQEDPKSLDTPIQSADVDGNRVVLTLSERVGDRGD